MWVSNFLGGGVMLIFGILIRVFNLSGLIAGYNTASPQEKARYNEKELTRFVGLMLIACGILLVAGGLIGVLYPAGVLAPLTAWGLFLIIIVSGVIYVNTNARFKKAD